MKNKPSLNQKIGLMFFVIFVFAFTFKTFRYITLIFLEESLPGALQIILLIAPYIIAFALTANAYAHVKKRILNNIKSD